jgi:hypothetical protein
MQKAIDVIIKIGQLTDTTDFSIKTRGKAEVSGAKEKKGKKKK